jgi:hypothetical protein
MRVLGYYLLLFSVTASAALGQADPVMKFQATSDWGSGFVGQISISNPSSQAITGWLLEFDFDRSIDTIWDGTLVSHSGDHYKIKSAGWNDSIASGAAVSFGFGGSPGDIKQGPSNFRLSSAPPETTGPSSDGVQITLTQTSRWAGGFSANLNVANAGAAPLSPWVLSFHFEQSIDAMWNGTFTRSGNDYQVTGSGQTASVPAAGSVLLGLTGSGTLTASDATDCKLNDTPCVLKIVLADSPTPPPASAIAIAPVDDAGTATQITIGQGTAHYALSLKGQTDPRFLVATNNPAVLSASIDGSGALELAGLAPGRASLRIIEQSTGATRLVGIRVLNIDGSLPGLPKHLWLGSVSEDTPAHLNFWQQFRSGAQNRRVDSRYIYLNGGPIQGWDTWSLSPGDREAGYIRISRTLGMIPFFVFYNIPSDNESYSIDVAHISDPAYMAAYFKNLKLALDIAVRESPDDPVGFILEPDFLGYLAQNANKPASGIPAATGAAYDSGVLDASTDPVFAPTVEGFVRAVNYTISKYAPKAVFGWQMNLWASPPGGWTTSVPNRGLMHKTDTGDYATGRDAVAAEAAAITRYYLAAGVASYGASFLSIDKYGLDATGFEPSAGNNPANSVWFWNNDHWRNYLSFVASIHQTSQLPVVLWQLPVGHINSSTALNPYSASGRFPDLNQYYQSYEDSSTTFFFGDMFTTTGARKEFFSRNASGDSGLTVSDDNITWSSHMTEAAAAGVMGMMFGAGVGASTTNVGDPPSDGFLWIVKAQEYLANPILAPAK